MTRIGVAVCAYKGHIPHLKRLFASIAQQTRLPDQVVVSCSSCTDEEIPYRQDMFPFPFRIVTVAEKQNCAQNRNRAASHLAPSVDIISFMDADDEMHPRRLEAMEEAFRLFPQTKIFLHNTHIAHDEKESFKPTPHFHYVLNRLYRCQWGSTCLVDPPPNMLIANGHVSTTTDAWQAVHFPESEWFQGRDDTFFTTVVISFWPKETVYCHNLLSRYYPSRTEGFREN